MKKYLEILYNTGIAELAYALGSDPRTLISHVGSSPTTSIKSL